MTQSNPPIAEAVMPELKPCPFCGGEASIIKDQWSNTKNLVILNHHNDCVIDLAKLFHTPENAASAWNTLAAAQADAGEKMESVQIVYTVYKVDDETTHIFSTPEMAQGYADIQNCPCVLSEYAVDCPERFYGETQ